mmetsp:Transcript_144873/g.255357  ORF Transcript_144873/g.255357 Transcript_144873/m.255357 type:complete len:422 (-) Transcript_144873:72-1337(-)
MRAGVWLAGLTLIQGASWGISTSLSQCEDVAEEAAVKGSNLLQLQVSRGEDRFGPDDCISLFRSSVGTCILKTDCPIATNISGVEFAFVCSNPNDAMPHALHSFGRGGFEANELFDTGVKCKSCLSVETAYKTGGPLMRNALAALPQGRLAARSTPGAHLPGALAEDGTTPRVAADIDTVEPEEVTHFGPKACVSTFQAPTGTCLIRTRCKDVDLSGFNIGVTCLDNSGGYTRYLFGKEVFQPVETFDTQLQCFKCLGVGAESSIFAAHTALPKQLMEDVGSLKMDVENLEERVRLLADSTQAKAPTGPITPPVPSPSNGRSSEKASDRLIKHVTHTGHSGHSANFNHISHDTPDNQDIAEQDEVRIPTIMVQRLDGPSASSGQRRQGPSEAMLVVRHRRAPVISELFRRIQHSHAKRSAD